MDKNLTTITETRGAFVMPARPIDRVRTMAVPNGFQGTGVSVAVCGPKVPAYAGLGKVAGTDRIKDTAVRLIKTTDVAHPRLEGPPV